MKNCRFYSDPFLASQKRLPWVGIFATKAIALKSTFEKSEWSCLASELKLLIKLLTFDGLKDTKLKICKLLMSKLQVGFYMYTYYLSCKRASVDSKWFQTCLLPACNFRVGIHWGLPNELDRYLLLWVNEYDFRMAWAYLSDFGNKMPSYIPGRRVDTLTWWDRARRINMPNLFIWLPCPYITECSWTSLP